MAAPDANALAGYLLERVKNDVHFLHSQQLLDTNERDTILSRLDNAAHRAASANTGGAVAALTSQFGATTVSGSSMSSTSGGAAVVAQLPPPQQHQQQQQHNQPPPMPARHSYNPVPPTQDNREKVRALWAYNGA